MSSDTFDRTGKGKPPPGGTRRRQRAHAAVARLTEARRAVLPLDGTLDVWVLAAITAINYFAAVAGGVQLIRLGAFRPWAANAENALWIGVVFAFIETIPGALFFGCGAPRTAPARCLSPASPCTAPYSVLCFLLSLLLAVFSLLLTVACPDPLPVRSLHLAQSFSCSRNVCS